MNWLRFSGAALVLFAITLPPLVAQADSMAAEKSSWIYFDKYSSATTGCHTTDSAAANAKIASYLSGSWCSTSFSNWVTAWPNSEGAVSHDANCRPADAPSDSTTAHMEERQFHYNGSTGSPGSCPPESGPYLTTIHRQFFYYCPNENYELWTPSGQSGDPIPVCRLKADKPSEKKQPRENNCCNTPHPINLATGDKYQREVDYVGTGAFPLRFQRFYSSGAWTHTYQRSIAATTLVPGTFVMIAANREDGRAIPFSISSGTMQKDPDVPEKLEQLFSGGSPSGWRFTDAQDAVELYDVNGRLSSITSRAGETQTLAYDGNGRLSTVTDPFGHQLTLTYDGSGRLATMTNPGSGVAEYDYDGSGRLSTVTYPDTELRTYIYNESANTSGANLPNALTGILDENNDRYATYKYDTQGRAIDSQHAGGADRVQVAYNTNGTRTVTDALGTSRTFTLTNLHGVGKLSSVSGSPCTGCGLNASYSYATSGYPTSRTDFQGAVTTFSFSTDGRGLENSRTEAYGTANARTITKDWHSTFRLPTEIVEANRTTTFDYDSDGNLLERTVTDTSVTPNVSRSWEYTYNGDGQVLTIDGPRTDVSDETTFTYYSCTSGDECGRVETIENALGHVTTYNTYNPHGQPLTITDPNGLVTTLTYDARQRLASREADGETTTFEYWPTGLLKKVTLPASSFIQYTYDEAHRLTQMEDAEGNSIVYTLDAMGNRTKDETFDPSSYLVRLHHRAFNTLNQLWKDIGSANSSDVTTTFGYDNNGNQTSADAPLGRDSSSAYDELNRLEETTDPESGTTQFGYDDNDNLTSVTDPRSKVTSYVYTGFGDLKQLTSPDTGVTNNVYDSGGNLLTSTDARSKTGTYEYDALNRVTEFSYPDQTITYTYDTGTNNKGRLMQVTDNSGSTSWTYSALGRVASRTQVMGSLTKAVSYGYNSDGQLTTLTTPSGQTITYGYANNRIDSITINSTTLLDTVVYDPFGPARQWDWGNSTLAVREFNQDGLVSQIDSAGLRIYSYDDAFRITEIEDDDNPDLSAAYTYDLADRLESYTLPEPAETPMLALDDTTATPGQTVEVTLTDIPAGSGLWLALAHTTAPDTTYNKWVAVVPSGGSFVWNVTMPAYAGTYEVRLFRGYFDELASSASIAVSAPSTPPQPTLELSATKAAPGATVTVRLAGGPGGSTDWLALAAVGAANTSYLQWVYVGFGVTSRDWTVTMPTTADDYEFRLFLNNGYTLAASSAPVLLTNAPPVSGGTVPGYEYDLNGNRTSGAGSTYTISSTSNRLVSVSGGISRTYGYDAAGNTTSYGGFTFTYNDAGRMTGVSGSATATYGLNALGQRVKKVASSVTTYFVYDEAGHLIGEYDGSGNLVQETVWMGDTPVATLRPNGGSVSIFYVHSDHLNTPRRISRPSDNSILWRWDSDPFGTDAANEDPDADTNLFKYGLRFPGQYFDAETGLSYNYFRDYDPQIGRYIESDPIGLRGGPNTYLYADADPVVLTDPTGENIWAGVRGAWWLGTRIGGAVSYGIEAAAGASLGTLIYEACHDEDEDEECEKATPWHLAQAGIYDPHAFKSEWGAVPNSRFDICACKDGSVVIKAVGSCGNPGPGIYTDARWK